MQMLQMLQMPRPRAFCFLGGLSRDEFVPCWAAKTDGRMERSVPALQPVDPSKSEEAMRGRCG